MKTKKSLHALCECGIMVALAVALSFLKISLWQNGGSVDLVCIPLALIGYRNGFWWGTGAGMAFGLIDCLIGDGIGWGILSVLLDYVLAYGMLGLVGLFRNKGVIGLEVGTLVACAARFAVHFVSGVTVWRIALGEEIELFGKTFGADAAYLYSFLYNGSYMLANAVLALAVLPILYPALQKRSKKNA